MEELFLKSEFELEYALKRIWRTDELSFVGHLELSHSLDENGFGYITNPIVNDREIFYPKPVVKRFVSIRIQITPDLVIGNYYKVYCKLASLDLRKSKMNPFLLLKDESKPLIPEFEHIPAKAFIEKWFYQKGATPGDSATIASQLKLNQLELYTHTKRFIFELIQNADDMPSKKSGVKIELHLLKNYLLFQHDGKFFDRNDVKAIADAAQSNKSENTRQTGYKGIGFKSVFTDATKVLIKSGSFSFKFDKNDSIYNDFWLLYKGYTSKLKPEALREFQRDFIGNEKEYTNIDNIPWQIKPIWVSNEQYPQELISLPFKLNSEVVIALDIGSNTLLEKKYHEMIIGLLSKPKFILFLRNTNSFKYFSLVNNEIILSHKIELINERESINISSNGELTASFKKKDFEIEISNEKFSEAGFSIERYEEKPGIYKFKDSSGEIKNIPEKLGRLDKSTITIAIQVANGEIQKLDKSQSFLYNYLPTSDQRFEFPFLVNADFISSTNREFVHVENKWNHYLFYYIGMNLIKWISELSEGIIDQEKENKESLIRSYLNLLPDELLDESNEELNIINNSFNRGLKNALKNIAFIVDVNKNIKTTGEIIIDNTGISELFGNQSSVLFHSLFPTSKSLPHTYLPKRELLRSYLEIEVFNNLQLKEILCDEVKRKILSNEIFKLSVENYTRFLQWLDGFSFLNFETNEWILSIPFIRIKQGVFSVIDIFQAELIHIKTEKTKNVERILEKIGFELTEFYLDNFPHLDGFVRQIESYLSNDIKLYERISSNKNLSKLTATEKNLLLLFLKNLNQVGGSKYAGTLPLFKSNRIDGDLKPLGKLISTECSEIPEWLTDFVIDEKEETELADDFKKHLLKQEDLLEKVFCNKELFDEIIINISEEQLASFYTYILQLYNSKPEEVTIVYTGIPWMYVPKTKSFQLPTEIYCPDSLLDLSIEQYESVSAVVETISDVVLPHYLALQLVKPFKLGFTIEAPIKRDGFFDGETTVHFLDWATAKDFLLKLNFSKFEERFVIKTSSKGVFQYYTTDESLISELNSKSVSGNLVLLPKELYSDKRKSIGLLEGNDLLKYLLENGLATVAFSRHITASKDNDLKIQYIDKLDSIELKSAAIYNEDTDEHRIIKMIIENGNELEGYFEKVKSKISIDGYSISERGISDDVFMEFKSGEITHKIELRLSGILKSYVDQTSSVNAIVDSFPHLNKFELRKVFDLSRKKPKKIFEELHASELEYLNPVQLFFLLIYKEYSNESDVLKSKLTFCSLYESNFDLYFAKATEFINLCYINNYHFYSSGIFLPDYNPKIKVLLAEYSLPIETIPLWLQTWLSSGERENKLKFLLASGINGDDSYVTKVRRGILESNKELFDQGIVYLDDNILLKNTLHWLKDQNLKKNFILKKEFLQPLYKKLESKKIPVSEILIPTLKEFDIDSYVLIEKTDSQEYHFINKEWGEYSEEIFKYLVELKKLIIDDVLPLSYCNFLKSINSGVKKEVNASLLENNSCDFDEDYYKEWTLKEKYPILIYKGQLIPYKIIYSNEVVKNITENYADTFAAKYYVIESEKKDMPYPLKGILPDNIFRDLQGAKEDYKRKKIKEESEVFSVEEDEALKRLFGDNIPSDYHKDLNLAALIKGLIYFSKNGYDVSEAEINLKATHDFSQLKPVYSKDGKEKLTIMGRSAKTGLLYLTANAWSRLDDIEINLFVATGKGESEFHLFKDKQSVLNISATDFQVYRVEADSKSENTDAILNGTFNKDKIWLIFKMKDTATYNSIFDGGIRRNEENPDFENVG